MIDDIGLIKMQPRPSSSLENFSSSTITDTDLLERSRQGRSPCSVVRRPCQMLVSVENRLKRYQSEAADISCRVSKHGTLILQCWISVSSDRLEHYICYWRLICATECGVSSL